MEMKNLTMNELKSNMCKWPVGDPKEDDFHFCGENCAYESPYCAEHSEMAYAKTRGHPGRRSK